MGKKNLILSALLFFAAACYAQPQRFNVINFSPKEYGKNSDVQNWAVVQDKQSGLLYFGNANGVLEYDGLKWEFIPCVRGVFTTALACDENGTIYVGTQYGFGYLIPDIYGKLQYYSLSDSLIDNYFNTIVWKIHILNNHVYFQTEDAIFDYCDGKTNVILPENSFHLSFVVNNQLLVRERNKGLMLLKGNKLIPFAGGEIFKDLGIFGIAGLSLNQWMVITQEKAIWIYNNGRFSEIKNSDSEVLINSGIYGSIMLYDGNIALNTISGGIIIIDRNAKILHQVNTSNSAINVNDIKQIIADRQGNIWCATNNGISVVYYSSALSVYGKESGLSSNIYSLAHFNGKLYAGTSTGLMYQDNNNFGKFVDLNLMKSSVWALLTIDNELIIGDNENLFAFDGNNLKNIDNLNTRSLCYIKELNLLFCGGKNGLFVYEKKNRNWTRKLQIENVNAEIIGLAYSKTGDNQFILWAGTLLNGVFAISFSGNLNFEVKNYLPSELNTEGYCLPFNTENQIVFGTNTGLVFLRSNSKSKKNIFANMPVYGFEIFKPVNYVLQAGSHLFISLSDLILHFTDSRLADEPLAGINAGKVRTIYTFNQEQCWFGCDDALISYHYFKTKPKYKTFKAIIRKVVCNSDSVIFAGKTFAGMDKPSLRYADNDLTFIFSADFYTFPEQTQFSWFLEGNDKVWSEWTLDNKAVYTNLHEGKYVFKVKARNVFGNESQEVSFYFEVKPPWHRTWLAFIAYLILLGIIVFAAIRISIYRVKQKNIRLEKIVKERTAEIARKNTILQEQKDVIEKEKAKSEELLLNTLPAKVVDELKEKGFTEPESFENVTVYFSDIKGFTDMSGSLDPKYLIGKLNEMFTAFDDIMSKYGCERIKTIGDAYMAVCGLPQKKENHAEMMVLAAIEILKYLEERNKTDDLPIRIRIGLNSGKVTGGIVGVRKYIYDVFGDTVNTASRMESNGEPMRINVSETTYNLLKDKFSFEERPPLEVKGKGILKMYFVKIEN